MSTVVADEVGMATSALERDTVALIHGIPVSWTQYNMSGVAVIDDSLNVTSLTDQGTGQADLTLTNGMAAATGAVENSLGLNSSGNPTQAQSGGHIQSSTVYRTDCATDSSARQDWQRGYIVLYGKF